jgi:hypothetical protein
VRVEQEPAAGEVVTEYGLAHKGGDWTVWNTAPHLEAAWPLAKRIEDYRRYQGAKVYRRRVIVVEDWAEVDAP